GAAPPWRTEREADLVPLLEGDRRMEPDAVRRQVPGLEGHRFIPIIGGHVAVEVDRPPRGTSISIQNLYGIQHIEQPLGVVLHCRMLTYPDPKKAQGPVA